MGFASDNASVMMGKHNSFMTRLKAETDALIVILYSSALVSVNACYHAPLRNSLEV